MKAKLKMFPRNTKINWDLLDDEKIEELKSLINKSLDLLQEDFKMEDKNKNLSEIINSVCEIDRNTGILLDETIRKYL